MQRQDHSFRLLRATAFFVSVLASTCIANSAAQAASGSVVGEWKTIDDTTHQPKSVVETYLKEGKLYGRIKQLLNAPPGTSPLCEKCTGSRKNAPFEGLEIVWDLTQDGDSWEKGSVLDPANGTVYKCRVKLASQDRLEIRGFVGISLFGRTQTWERVVAADKVPPKP